MLGLTLYSEFLFALCIAVAVTVACNISTSPFEVSWIDEPSKRTSGVCTYLNTCVSRSLIAPRMVGRGPKKACADRNETRAGTVRDRQLDPEISASPVRNGRACTPGQLCMRSIACSSSTLLCRTCSSLAAAFTPLMPTDFDRQILLPGYLVSTHQSLELFTLELD